MSNCGCAIQMMGVREMSKGQKNSKEKTVKETTGKEKEEKFYIAIGGLKIKGSAIVFMVIIPFLVSLGANIAFDTYKDRKSNEQEVTLESLQASIEDITGRLEKLENLDGSNEDGSADDERHITIILSSLKQTSDKLLDVSQGSGELVVNLDQPTWKLEDKILYDTKSGIEFTAGQVVNQEILLKYKNDTEEIYFLGQFNENNHWNDNCLINVYENNVLKSIMEAKYDDGNLISYKQVAKTNSSTDTVWSISDKEHYEDHNSGITKNYIYTVYNQEIEYENASEEGMIRVDDFENIMKAVSTLEGYYSGNTSEGRYNDSTGSAYIAKYYEDGTIRFLYRGYFAGGYPEDSRNNEQDGPWGIVYAEDGPYYVRNVGSHTKGSADHKSNKALSIDDINKIVSEYNFECKLNWKES